MATPADETAARGAPTPAQAALVVIGIVVAVALLLAIAAMLGLAPFMMPGFLFALYWGGIKHLAWPELAPGVIGSLGGLGLACLMHVLPAALGTPGLAIGLGLILLAVYLLVLQSCSLLINNAFMLLLTVGATSLFVGAWTCAGAAGAILLTAGYMAGLIALAGAIVRRRARAA